MSIDSSALQPKQDTLSPECLEMHVGAFDLHFQNTSETNLTLYRAFMFYLRKINNSKNVGIVVESFTPTSIEHKGNNKVDLTPTLIDPLCWNSQSRT